MRAVGERSNLSDDGSGDRLLRRSGAGRSRAPVGGRSRVSRWTPHIGGGSSGLARDRCRVVPSKLTGGKRTSGDIALRGAAASGLSRGSVTCPASRPRDRPAIRIRYHVDHIGDCYVRWAGPQRPIRALGSGRGRIRRWIKQDWPASKKGHRLSAWAGLYRRKRLLLLPWHAPGVRATDAGALDIGRHRGRFR